MSDDHTSKSNGFSRRRFLQTLGVSAAAAPLARSADAQQRERTGADGVAILGPGPVNISLRINGKPYAATIDPATGVATAAGNGTTTITATVGTVTGTTTLTVTQAVASIVVSPTDPTLDAVGATRAAGGRVVAVGTTTARVLESCVTSEATPPFDGDRPAPLLRPGTREPQSFLRDRQLLTMKTQQMYFHPACLIYYTPAQALSSYFVALLNAPSH